MASSNSNVASVEAAVLRHSRRSPRATAIQSRINSRLR